MFYWTQFAINTFTNPYGRGNRETRRRCLVRVLIECGSWKEEGGSKDKATTCINCYHIFFMINRLFSLSGGSSPDNVRWLRSGRRSETSKHGVDANARSRARHLGGPLNRTFASIIVIIVIVLKMGKMVILWIITDRGHTVSLCLFVYDIVPAEVDHVHVHVCDCPGDCVLPIYANCVYFDVCVCGCVFIYLTA